MSKFLCIIAFLSFCSNLIGQDMSLLINSKEVIYKQIIINEVDSVLYTHYVKKPKHFTRIDTITGTVLFQFNGNYIKEIPLATIKNSGKIGTKVKIKYDKLYDDVIVEKFIHEEGVKEWLYLQTDQAPHIFNFLYDTNLSKNELLKHIIEPFGFDADGRPVKLNWEIGDISAGYYPFTLSILPSDSIVYTYPLAIDPSLTLKTLFDFGTAVTYMDVCVLDDSLGIYNGTINGSWKGDPKLFKWDTTGVIDTVGGQSFSGDADYDAEAFYLKTVAVDGNYIVGMSVLDAGVGQISIETYEIDQIAFTIIQQDNDAFAGVTTGIYAVSCAIPLTDSTIFYGYSTDSRRYLKGRVVYVNPGNYQIAIKSEFTFFDAGTNNIMAINGCKVKDNKVVICYRDASISNELEAVVVTVSNDTFLTSHTRSNDVNGLIPDSGIFGAVGDNSRVIYMSDTYGANAGAVCGYLQGDTIIVWGTLVDHSLSYSRGTDVQMMLDDTTFIAVGRGGVRVGNLESGITSTTITYETGVTAGVASGYPIMHTISNVIAGQDSFFFYGTSGDLGLGKFIFDKSEGDGAVSSITHEGLLLYKPNTALYRRGVLYLRRKKDD